MIAVISCYLRFSFCRTLSLCVYICIQFSSSMCLCCQDEKEEWRRFQADLQTAVVVANDIKVEAQQELRSLRRQLQEEQDRSAKLSADLEALQGVRYHLHHNPLFQFLPTQLPLFHWAAVSFYLNICGCEIPARVLPYLHPVLHVIYSMQTVVLYNNLLFKRFTKPLSGIIALQDSIHYIY